MYLRWRKDLRDECALTEGWICAGGGPDRRIYSLGWTQLRLHATVMYKNWSLYFSELENNPTFHEQRRKLLSPQTEYLSTMASDPQDLSSAPDEFSRDSGDPFFNKYDFPSLDPPGNVDFDEWIQRIQEDANVDKTSRYATCS